MFRIALFVLVALVAACKKDPVTLSFGGETMGTTYSVVAIDPSAKLNADDVKAAVEATLTKVNAGMSNWDPKSEVSLFNAAQTSEPQPVTPEFAKVMAAANEVHRLSEGQFDVTLGPLIELWEFGARNSESPIPPDDAITAALDVVGQAKVLELDAGAGTLSKKYEDTSIYLAAIAKGYGVDEVAATLAGFEISDYLVEIGGDLVTSGKNAEGQPWRIGIERPEAGTSGQVEEVVNLSGRGMATSGDYRNYFEEDGVRYSHIIDAVSGRPITHTTASVTVLAENAMMADAWATALLALGQERGMPIAEELDLAVLFIARDPNAQETSFVHASSSAFDKLK